MALRLRTMGRSCRLSVERKAKIRTLVKKKLSYSAIAKSMKRSRTAVRNFVCLWRSSARARKGESPKHLSPRAVQVVVGAALQPDMTARRVLERTGVLASQQKVLWRLTEGRLLRLGPHNKASSIDQNHLKPILSGIQR